MLEPNEVILKIALPVLIEEIVMLRILLILPFVFPSLLASILATEEISSEDDCT